MIVKSNKSNSFQPFSKPLRAKQLVDSTKQQLIFHLVGKTSNFKKVSIHISFRFNKRVNHTLIYLDPTHTQQQHQSFIKHFGFGFFKALDQSWSTEISRKVINTPKLISFNWLKEIRKALKDQKLRRFLEMSGNTFPDLVKVFYTNLLVDGENMYSHVKGVDMKITPTIWFGITRLKYSVLRINKGNTSVVEDFNKIQYYVSCLKYHHLKVKGFHVGALKLNERITAFIVTWMLTPRGSNHVVLTKEDLVLIYYIMKNIKINWIHVFMKHMLALKRQLPLITVVLDQRALWFKATL